ncbi:MAG TPA: maleylpyruvate isomerase N-terminal domain-containing protein [Candidatus Limnocylindrales bacterium]|nr:maleylpyruvate isomerase N-terminal domain-containing protein [Candidatus Limnocylindrales bacterium]
MIAGIDDAGWRLPGAAPSDAGGPDWSLLDHVGHLVHWQELDVTYVERVLDGGMWPSDEEFDGGDFDRYNERHRATWADAAPALVRSRLTQSRAALLERATRLSPDVIRNDAAWGWIFMVLHGHALDHLSILDPWSDALRARQADGDPFDPAAALQPVTAEAMLADARGVLAHLAEVIGPVGDDRWSGSDVTPGWSLADHVNHLADWYAECSTAIDDRLSTGVWPEYGIGGGDVWNERAVARSRGLRPAETRRRHEFKLARLIERLDQLDLEAVRSPDGWTWIYECLHGHVRVHLALVGPWCVRAGWPAP